MKILVLSDIHAQYNALQALRNEMQAADHILCLGDIVGYHTQVNEVIDELRQYKNLTCIMGNHDDFLLRGYPNELPSAVKRGIDYAKNAITVSNKNWLASLPISWAGFMDGISFLLVHGSPWSPFKDYLYTNSPLIAKLAAFDYDIICFGQTHRAYVQTINRPYLINPGSVGQSRDRKDLACALAIDTREMSFTPIERLIISCDVRVEA